MDEVEAKVRKFEELCGTKLYDWQREILIKSISSDKKLYITFPRRLGYYNSMRFAHMMNMILKKEGEKNSGSDISY